MPFMVIEEIKPHPVAQSETARQIEKFSLKSEMEQLDDHIEQAKKKYYRSDFYKQYTEYKQTFLTQVYRPLATAYKRTYHELPEETTNRKFGLLEKLSFDSRFVLLNGLALGSALYSMKGANRYNSLTFGIRALRNSAVTYCVAGLIIAPEIFNPLLKKWQTLRADLY